MRIQHTERTQVGMIVEGRLNYMGIGVKQLAIEIKLTYEYCRRIIRGESVPSEASTSVIAQTLGLDVKLLQQARAADLSRESGFKALPERP
jgi:ribosome-binding protein aMBF1 (putative translation factor)